MAGSSIDDWKPGDPAPEGYVLRPDGGLHSTRTWQVAPMPGTGVALFKSFTYVEVPQETPVSLSAIVTLHEQNADGRRIEVLGPAWREIHRLVSEGGIESLMHLDPRKWEEIVAARYAAEGYEVTLTPRSGDGGKDVIAVKRGFASVRLIDQVKAYRRPHLVTADEVRALLGVMLGDQATVTRAVLTTTSGFAPRINDDPIIAKHQPYRLDLVDGPALQAAILQWGGIPR